MQKSITTNRMIMHKDNPMVIHESLYIFHYIISFIIINYIVSLTCFPNIKNNAYLRHLSDIKNRSDF